MNSGVGERFAATDRGSEGTDYSNHSEGDVVVVMEEEFENEVGGGSGFAEDEAKFYGAVDGVIAQIEKKPQTQKDKVREMLE